MTRVVLRGGRVFDGTGADPGPADVAVEDGRIVGLGTGLDGNEEVDVRDRTILPGMFDCHTHVCLSDVDLWGAVQRPFSAQFYEAAKNLQKTLAIGITSVRDAGGADLGIKEAVADGSIAGPRLQISITMLSQTGGHGDDWFPSGVEVPLLGRHPGVPDTIVDGPEEMRRVVRLLIRHGADVIKIATSGGVLSPRDKPTHGHFRDDELAALAAEAAAADVPIMAHAQATPGIKAALRAGVRSIEHGIYLDDEAIGMMKQRGAWLVPTLMAPLGVIEAADAGLAIPEASLAKARDVVDIHRQSFSNAVAAGVRIAMGTDSGVTRHGHNLRELALMEQGGMSPSQVLVATTLSAAQLMRVDGELGTIEPGKRADLVVVKGGAYELATLPDRIEAVYQDGARVVG
jgi:imidazolonepropionase-like amidohydrolase